MRASTSRGAQRVQIFRQKIVWRNPIPRHLLADQKAVRPDCLKTQFLKFYSAKISKKFFEKTPKWQFLDSLERGEFRNSELSGCF